MTVAIYDLQSGSASRVSVRAETSQSYCVYVEHRGRWIQGGAFSCLDKASQVANDAHKRSGLPVEVRDNSGDVSLQLRPEFSESDFFDLRAFAEKQNAF